MTGAAASTWREAAPDRSGLHFVLTHEEMGQLEIAVVEPPQDTVSQVELASPDQLEPQLRELVQPDVRADLDYYLLDVGLPDPWAYALYRWGTQANVYARVHLGGYDPALERDGAGSPGAPEDEG